MKKSDLKVGYLVKDRSGRLKMLMESTEGLVFIYENMTSHGSLDYYDNDLLHYDKGCDIMEIYGFSDFASQTMSFNTRYRELLWEREEAKKMTVAEIEDILGYKIEVISES